MPLDRFRDTVTLLKGRARDSTNETTNERTTTMCSTATTETAATYANRLGYSDVHPYEIVRRVSDRTLEVRPMKSELASDWTPEWVSGGFAGHCTNQQTQRWDIVSDPTADVIRIRLGKKGWKSAGGSRFVLDSEPRRFNDFNF